MNRTDLDPWAIGMHLAFGTPAQTIASMYGERLEMLIHRLAVNGCPDLSVRLADAARVTR